MPSLLINRTYKQKKLIATFVYVSISFLGFVFAASMFSDSSLQNTLRDFSSKVEFRMQIKILLELSKGH